MIQVFEGDGQDPSAKPKRPRGLMMLDIACKTLRDLGYTGKADALSNWRNFTAEEAMDMWRTLQLAADTHLAPGVAGKLTRMAHRIAEFHCLP